MYTVTCQNHRREFSEGSTFLDAANHFRFLYSQEPLVAVTSDYHETIELFNPILDNVNVRFLTGEDPQGARAYVRTAEFLFLRAVSELTGRKNLSDVQVEFDVNGNLFFTFGDFVEVTSSFSASIKERMLRYISDDDPIRMRLLHSYNYMDAIREKGLENVIPILQYKAEPFLRYYTCGEYNAYFYSPLCSSAGYIRVFDVQLFDDGIMLVLPRLLLGSWELNPVCISFKSFETQKANASWASSIQVNNTSDLNNSVCNRKIRDLIQLQEAYFEKQLGDIAQDVAMSGKRVVLVAGPSSSGKTTTAYRLAIQMRALGLHPTIISSDNYYRNIEDYPLDADGTPNMESIHCLNLELLNQNFLDLLAGKTVSMPTHDFFTGKMTFKGNTLTLENQGILILEGIHCLNPLLTERLPEDCILRIYLSALTPLNVDNFNHIYSTDLRLLRRICRDARTRGYSADATISKWGSVLNGETVNLLPYQENADIILNTALIYEISVLKLYAEPLLYTVSRESPQYPVANRLLKLLSFVLSCSPDLISDTSILREFIGGSSIDIG